MNDKATVILAAAVIIVAACIAATFINANDEDSKDGFRLGDPGSDYTILDSNDRIAAGLTAKTVVRSDGFNENYTLVVGSVADGNVTYNITQKGDMSCYYDLSKFLPGGTMVWDLDYTADSPDPALTYSKDGNVYTINGSTIPPGYTSHVTFYQFKITYDGSAVTNVEGRIVSFTESEHLTDNDDSTFTTKDGKAWCESVWNATYKGSSSIADFYGVAFETYDQSYYAGATVTQDTGKYGNVDCTVYIINGTIITDGYVFQDYRIYVYNGYVLCETGVVNGNPQSVNTSIFVPE